MQGSTLTDKAFWVRYWQDFVPRPVERVPFDTLFEAFPKSDSTFLEIGGFPGTFCAYFAKQRAYRVSLLDFVIVDEIINRVEMANGLPAGTIHIIENDLFSYEPPEQFDVVMSAGFVEHFEDTELVLRKHVALLRKGGTLFATMPNFCGLNGWLQRALDPGNYRVHNTKAMDIGRLGEICRRLGLDSVEIFYHYASPYLWLDATARAGEIVRSSVERLSWVLARCRLRHHWWAPHIVLRGKK